MQHDMMDDLEFEKQIASFSPEGRFLARQMYDISECVDLHIKDDRLHGGLRRRQMVTSGGIGATIGTAIGTGVIALVNYLKSN